MTVVATLALLVVVYLLLAPLVIQAITSFRGPYLPFGQPGITWSAENYHTLYTGSGDFLLTIGQTCLFVGGAAAISFTISSVLAWLVARTELPGRHLIAVLAVLPFVLPPIVRAQAYQLMLASSSGVLNEVLRLAPWWNGSSGPIDPFSFPSVVVLEAMGNIPFTFWLLVPILQKMDGTLEEAARISGASWSYVLRRVTVPALWPSALGVFMLAIMLMLGDLEIPLLFGQESGSHIFSLRLWNLVNPAVGQLPAYGVAAAYGMNFLVFMSILFYFYLRITRRAEGRETVSGKGFRPKRLRLGRMKWPTVILVSGYLVPTAILPLVALAWSAATPYVMSITRDNLHKMTLSAFRTVLGDSSFWQSAARTVIIAGLSATIAAVVATILAYLAVRSRRRLTRQLLDVIGMSSIAIPATIAGFSAFILYLVLNPYIPLSGTIWVLVLTYAYRMSVSYRTSYGAILQISPELEESASLHGGSRLTVFRRITLPLVMPTVLSVWAQMFILGVNEFTLAAFLSTPSTAPLSMYIYSSIDPKAATYHPSQGAAAALLFTVAILAGALILQRLAKRRRTRPGARASKAPGPRQDGVGLETSRETEPTPV